jgi:hypothetical protein
MTTTLPTAEQICERRTCTISDCGRKHYALGWCEGHYKRQKKYGSPVAGKPLTKTATKAGAAMEFFQNEVLTYQGDDCLLWRYSRFWTGYGSIYIDGRRRLVHRVACEHRHGRPPTPSHQAAHNCGNGHLGCVNPRHLRWATRKENMADKAIHPPKAQRVIHEERRHS